MAGRIGTGAGGSLGCGIEALKGVPVGAISNWLPVDTCAIGAPFDVLRKNTYFGSRHMLNVVAQLKAKVGGTFAMSSFSNAVGMPLISGTGKEIYYPASPADAVAAGGMTDSQGLTAIPLVNSTGYTYQWGENITVATGALQECTPIARIVGNGAPGTTLYTKQLLTNTPRGAGTLVQAIPQRQVTVRGWTDAQAWECPTLELEKNIGRQFAWRLNGSRILKYDVKANKEDINITFTVACTELPFRLDQPGTGVLNPYTTFNPTVYEKAELTRPFTIRNSYVIVPNDNQLILTSGAPYLTAPPAPVPTTATTGGTVLAGVYGAIVSYVNPQGETTGSVAGTVTTAGTTSTITVPSPAAAGTGQAAATAYYVYLTQAGGSTYTRQQAPGSPTALGTPFVLTAPPTNTGLAPPVTNTAGTLVLQNAGQELFSRLAEVEDINFSWDNHGIDKDFHNDNPVKDNYLGGTSGAVQYKYSTTAGRWSDWEDYLVKPYADPVPFIWRQAVNIGSLTSPVWRCCTFAIPAMKIVTTTEADPLNDTLAVTVNAEVVEPTDGSPLLSIWIADDLVGAYPIG